MSPVRVQRRRAKGWRTPLCSCGCGQPARYVGRALKAIETNADSATLTLTRAGGHYLAECETRPGRSQP